VGLFALTHVTTVIYAVVVAGDLLMALMFGINAAGRATIIALTWLKRHAQKAIPRRSPQGIATSPSP
jgi:hypothetical protein